MLIFYFHSKYKGIEMSFSINLLLKNVMDLETQIAKLVFADKV